MPPPLAALSIIVISEIGFVTTFAFHGTRASRPLPLGLMFLNLMMGAASAATVAPPMLDIIRQCDVVSRHNAAAMSECVVAESEARAELLNKWEKLSDASAQKCIKTGRKASKLPYTAMAKCLAVEPVDVRPPAKSSDSGR